MESIDIYLAPAMRRHHDTSFELKQVNLTWSAIKYLDNKEMDELEIKIDFNHPHEISPKIVMDLIVVHFKDREKFTCIGKRVTKRMLEGTEIEKLARYSHTLYAKIPR